jgi:integrase
VTDALKAWQTRDGVIRITGYVWPGRTPDKPKDFRAPFDAALRAAGIEKFRFHDLRHTAGSYLAKAGVNQAQIMRAMGHRSFAASKRYLHLDDKDVQFALERTLASRTGGIRRAD